MSFNKINDFPALASITDAKLARLHENTQLASRLLASLIVSSATLSNFTGPTAFNKSWTMPANTIDRVGSILVVRACGLHSNTGTPTLRLRIQLGGVDIFDNNGLTTVSGAANYPWDIETKVLVRQLASGSQCILVAGSYIRLGSAIAANVIKGLEDTTRLVTLDFTTSNVIQVTAEWGAASASNTAIMNGMSVSLETAENTIS